MARAKAIAKSRLVVYMSQEQKDWLERKAAQLKTGQSDYLCFLIDEKRAEDLLSLGG